MVVWLHCNTGLCSEPVYICKGLLKAFLLSQFTIRIANCKNTNVVKLFCHRSSKKIKPHCPLHLKNISKKNRLTIHKYFRSVLFPAPPQVILTDWQLQEPPYNLPLDWQASKVTFLVFLHRQFAQPHSFSHHHHQCSRDFHDTTSRSIKTAVKTVGRKSQLSSSKTLQTFLASTQCGLEEQI